MTTAIADAIQIEKKIFTILYAEDDEDDFFLLSDSLRKANFKCDLHRVRNGQEALDFLYHKNAFQDSLKHPRPNMVLLDLKMPIMDGNEALKRIRSDKEFSKIPVVVLTSSKATEDISKSYGYGANSYIQKPDWYEEMISLVNMIGRYWFQLIVLPEEG